MASKKDILARIASLTGVTRLLELQRGKPSLLILNYHRVGDQTLTPYDSGTFSATTAELDWQVGWLKERYPIVTLAEAVEIVHGRTKPTRASVLITFDDGYKDNYDEAFPVLKRHGASATFFLPTLFVGGHQLPWWDEIAYMVKGSGLERIELTYPAAATVELKDVDRAVAVVTVLELFKQAPAVDTERFLDGLSEASGTGRPGDHSERCFLNWDEAREMQAAGMCFGSHTHTHEILGRLPYERQLEELTVSRTILELELGREIDTLAYPRGKRGTFSDVTWRALREAQYSTAFSFYAGVNKPGRIEPLDVLRDGVDGDDRDRFRLRWSLYAAAGLGLV
jgi:peptidoglycan/xylan/chitin deacetylase (PgdA/CDA1 family)